MTKMKNKFMALREYISNWHKIEERPPHNETAFIDGFIEYTKEAREDIDFSFHGDGAYFGKEICLLYQQGTCIDFELSFEIAYCSEQISIYRADHGGCWQPTFLSMGEEHSRFEEVKSALYDLLYYFLGLPNPNPNPNPNQAR